MKIPCSFKPLEDLQKYLTLQKHYSDSWNVFQKSMKTQIWAVRHQLPETLAMVNVVFLHPDLGIGGAERAVIDAALALKSKGHQVQFVTSHHDPSHCFQETKDGTLQVTSVGDWLPRRLLGRCYALCAYIRMIYAALYVSVFSSLKFDIIFCDQISACIPVLLLSPAKIIFYCHFPDMLLTSRQSLLKKIYRKPIDWLEEFSTGLAHKVLVNSHFTASIFRETFTSLHHVNPSIVYPIPDFNGLNKPVENHKDIQIPDKPCIFLSINRYERKKNLALAIRAFGLMVEQHGSSSVHLIIAGGYDERVNENIEYHQELQNLAEQLHLVDHVTFLRSFSDSQKRWLLSRATCLLYTPEREHFGIVPIEAMYLRCPVIAVNSGGPLETVDHGKTGFLCQSMPETFSKEMSKFLLDKELHRKLGENGRKRVEEKFSFETFTSQLCSIVTELSNDKKKQPKSSLWTLVFIALFAIAIISFLPLASTA